MKQFASRLLLAGTLALAGISCSDDDPESSSGFGLPDAAPAVKLLDVRVSRNAISVTVAPDDAIECAYLLAANDTGTPADEEILTAGVAVDPSTSTRLDFADLEYETPYMIAVAARNEAGATSSTSLVLVTGKNPFASAGQPANTYIVSDAGGHRFETKKVSGTPIANIAKVDWIWATKNNEADTQQQLISDIVYADGEVTFNASGKRGNVVLAAFDASNTVIWTWLIWCTDTPKTMKFSSGSEFQDRVIGATGATKQDGQKAWGTILYQWGRSVPIFGGYEDEYDADGETFNEARKWTLINPAYGFEWQVVKETTTMEGSFAAPTTFFIGQTLDLNGETIYHWLDHDDRELWCEGKKTDYDPCPAGYRLPQPEDWGDDLLKNMSPASDLSGATYSFQGNTAWFPVSGCGRAYDTGENVRGIKSQFIFWNGRISKYNFISPDLPQFDTYFPSRIILGIETNMQNIDAMSNRTFAHATRCVAMD